MAGCPVYIVHLSCNDALEKVREARDRGLPVYAETCPQYLYLSLENMDAPGFEGAKYVFTPPLREKWHQEKLWHGLAHDSAKTTSPKSPTAAPASSIASVSSTPAVSTVSASPPTVSSKSSPPPPQNSSAFSRAKAPSRSAPTPT
jgi:hypothetical protein